MQVIWNEFIRKAGKQERGRLSESPEMLSLFGRFLFEHRFRRGSFGEREFLGDVVLFS